MKHINVTLAWIYLLLLMVTIGYCWLVWLVIAVVETYPLLDPGITPTLLSRITASGFLPFPYHAVVWQLLAVTSLITTFVWGLRRAKSSDVLQAHTLPILVHLSWILLCLIWHGIGALDPMIVVNYILKS